MKKSGPWPYLLSALKDFDQILSYANILYTRVRWTGYLFDRDVKVKYLSEFIIAAGGGIHIDAWESKYRIV